MQSTQTLKLDSDSSVGEWVVDRPSRSRIFERLGIDYCCGGKHLLDEACRQKGLDTEQVIDKLVREGDPAADAGKTAPVFHCGSLANPIAHMEHEYHEVGLELQREHGRCVKTPEVGV